MNGLLSVWRLTRAFRLAAAVAVCCAIAASGAGQAGSAQSSGRPTPAQVRTGERTALIWTSQISRFEPFDSVVEYRVEPDWHAIAE